MYTMYGPEAKDGDFVLVLDVQYNRSVATIHIAQVKGKKAYAAAVIPSGDKSRWLRKETAITVFPASGVSEDVKTLINMNIASQKALFENRTDYSEKVFSLVTKIRDAKVESRVAKYGEEYRYYYQ